MTFYGGYTRSVKQDGELVKLRIRRVVCSECGSTHALLLSEIVPYSRTLLADQADIISGCPVAVMERNPLLDENCVHSILRQFKKHWEQTLRHFAPVTIERWYRSYKQGGFETLIPTGRNDAGRPRRLDDALQAQIRYLKASYPRMSAAAIFRQLKEDGSIGSGEVSQAAISRFLNQIEFQEKHTGNQDMRRYERPHINEAWCGDSSAGPYLKTQDGKKRRVYVIALIDDASRFITGADVFFRDNFVNLMSVMKSAVAKYGRPKTFNFDNGSSYKNKQMELLAARIGSTLNYCRPYTPTAKAKIERTVVPHHEGPVDGIP